MSEKEFVAGLFVKAPHERAPDFVKASLSIKRADLGNWLRSKSDEWINVDVKQSQGGKWYAEVNTFVPDKAKTAVEDKAWSAPDYSEDSIPF
jgi:hypothetical protein